MQTEKLYHRPLRGLQAFERLRADFLTEHPSADEKRVLEACMQFAEVCRLPIRATESGGHNV